jgi:hypothetical protein
MAGNSRETSKERAFGAPPGATVAGAGFDKPERGHRSLYCVAIGADPAGIEHRIKIREEGSSFTMIDSRRRCRVPAHWACRLAEEDIAREVAFVFRVKVKGFEYPEPDGKVPPQRTRPSKSKYWKSWGRKTMRPRG